jgi:hypothetical protein
MALYTIIMIYCYNFKCVAKYMSDNMYLEETASHNWNIFVDRLKMLLIQLQIKLFVIQ